MHHFDLITLFQRGFIPGPEEDLNHFLTRAANNPPLNSVEWKGVANHLQITWGFSIDWPPITYSKKSLSIWEAAAFWEVEDGRCFVQIHPFFQYHTFRGKSLSTILSHEAVHASRKMFQEPFFEEHLAYSTAASYLDKMAGPLFHSSYELMIFVICLIGLPWIPVISTCLLLFFAFRLIFTSCIFSHVKKKLHPSLLICLTDQEIVSLAFKGKDFFLNGSLRHQLIEALNLTVPAEKRLNLILF